MPLVYTYTDAYLMPLVTEAREAQATTEVAELGAFPEDWLARLVIVRAYVLTCLESMRAPDDTFAAKLAAYRKEFDHLLPQARAALQAAQAAAGTQVRGSLFTIELLRG